MGEELGLGLGLCWNFASPHPCQVSRISTHYTFFLLIQYERMSHSKLIAELGVEKCQLRNAYGTEKVGLGHIYPLLHGVNLEAPGFLSLI